jgi:hypothetical protein
LVISQWLRCHLDRMTYPLNLTVFYSTSLALERDNYAPVLYSTGISPWTWLWAWPWVYSNLPSAACFLNLPGRDGDGWCCLPRSTTQHTWPFSVAEGIAKCIVIVVDTAGARTHAPTACVQGYSRSRVAKW